MMRLLHIVFFFLILLFLCLSLTYAAPKAYIDQTDFYAGEILKGKEVTHEFTLKNTGDEPLIIKDIKRC